LSEALLGENLELDEDADLERVMRGDDGETDEVAQEKSSEA
jgi:hypothetical protein